MPISPLPPSNGEFTPIPSDSGGVWKLLTLAAAGAAIVALGYLWTSRSKAPPPALPPPPAPLPTLDAVTSKERASEYLDSRKERLGEVQRATDRQIQWISEAISLQELGSLLLGIKKEQWPPVLKGLAARDALEESDIVSELAAHLDQMPTIRCIDQPLAIEAIWKRYASAAALVKGCWTTEPLSARARLASHLYLVGDADRRAGIKLALTTPEQQAPLVMGVATRIHDGGSHGAVLTHLVRTAFTVEKVLPLLPAGDLALLHLAGNSAFNRVKAALVERVKAQQSPSDHNHFPWPLKYASTFNPKPAQAQKLAMDLQKYPATVDLLLHYQAVKNLDLYVEVLHGLCCQKFSSIPRRDEVITSINELHFAKGLNGHRAKVVEALRRTLQDEAAIDPKNGAALFALFSAWEEAIPECLNKLQLSKT